MTVKVTAKKTLTWDETTPGAWKWLTFGALCEIVEAGRVQGIGADCFVYVLPELSADGKKVRGQELLITDEESL